MQKAVEWTLSKGAFLATVMAAVLADLAVCNGGDFQGKYPQSGAQW